MALRDRYDPEDPFPDRFVYALRHHGPTADTPLGGGRKLGRKATHVRHLLRELAVYADWDSGACYPRQELLAEHLGVTRPTVSEAVTAAVAIGWLEVRKRPAPQRTGKDWGGNIYRLIIPEAAEQACRESRQAKSGGTEGESGPAPDGRRESRQAGDVACRVSDDGRRVWPDARRESRRERVGKADTNTPVEPSGEPSRKHGARARAGGVSPSRRSTGPAPTYPDLRKAVAWLPQGPTSPNGSRLEQPFDEWAPPPELTDLATLYGRLDTAAMQFVAHVLGTPPNVMIRSARDLEMLPKDALRTVQYHVHVQGSP